MIKKSDVLTMKQAEVWLHKIKSAALSGDHEAAYSLEIDLYKAFVTYTSKLRNPIAIKARKVLEAQEIDFSRHCF